MHKAKWPAVFSAFLLLSIIMQVLTGFMLSFDMFSYKKEFISVAHLYNGFILAGLTVIHLALNWNWIKANFLKKIGSV